MSKKRILLTSTVILVLLGVLMFSYPFVASMRPVEKIPADAYKIDVSAMLPNTSRLIITKHSRRVVSDASTTWEPGGGLLVVRGEAEDFYLYLLPMWEGKVIMPWRSWWQHDGYCPGSDFGLQQHKSDRVILCSTHNYDEFLTKQWHWSIKGENLGDDPPDLMRVHFAKEGDALYAFTYLR
jgi:hypothetical protein